MIPIACDRCNSGMLHIYCMAIEMWVTHWKMPFTQAKIRATKDSGKAVYFDLCPFLDDTWNFGHFEFWKIELWNNITGRLWWQKDISYREIQDVSHGGGGIFYWSFPKCYSCNMFMFWVKNISKGN